jgi:hypothetical protein
VQIFILALELRTLSGLLRLTQEKGYPLPPLFLKYSKEEA